MSKILTYNAIDIIIAIGNLILLISKTRIQYHLTNSIIYFFLKISSASFSFDY